MRASLLNVVMYLAVGRKFSLKMRVSSNLSSQITS